RRPERASRARHARGPRTQRRRARVGARLGEGHRVHGDRALLPRDAPGEPRHGPPAARDRRPRSPPGVLPRRHPHRRAEDPRDGDHRRARAHPARPLRRRRWLRVVLGQPRLVHHDPDDRLPRSARVGPGRRRHRRRLRSEDRVARDVLEGPGDAARAPHGGGRGAAMILVIDNYDSFTYNLVQYLGELGVDLEVVRNDAVDVERIVAMAPQAIVISPGPGTPDQAGVSLGLIRRLGSTTPVLGVCLGHQAIGQAYGATVARAKAQMHGKTSMIRHDGRGVFAGLSNPFVATRYHSLAVLRDTVPETLEVTAEAED